MRDDRFEWDDARAEINRRKHGVAFDEARHVFDDVNGVDELDDEPDEERWQWTGLSRSGVLLLVIYTMRGARRRIISARKADRNDEDRYYRQARP